MIIFVKDLLQRRGILIIMIIIKHIKRDICLNLIA